MKKKIQIKSSRIKFEKKKTINYNLKKTYAGINGGGKAPPARPCGAPGPGRFGIAGAARLVAGGGGGPRPVPCKYTCNSIQFI